MTIKPAHDDKREIEAIVWGTDDEAVITVGAYGVTRIEVYEKKGRGSFTSWIAVYKGDFLQHHHPVHHVYITYKEDKGDD